jgi:hypothetical protein
MSVSGLLFIPDISGFTDFINETEVDHSRYIIQELLETLINSNKLQLQVSEIEGDAILFYRFGQVPTMNELFGQVQTMFENFHRALKFNSARRICQCNACKKADSLTLKMITHTGEFSNYTVKEFNKLIGKDVILIHQLLKNDIPMHEYWMVTQNCIAENKNDPALPELLQWNKGSKTTEHGVVDFYYSMLTPLKEKIRYENGAQLGIKGKREKVLTLEKEFSKDMQRMLSVIGDLNSRSKWLDGLKGVDGVTTSINQVGTSHRCLLDKNIEIMTTSDFYSDDYKIILEETDKKRMATFQFELSKISESATLLRMNIFMKKNPVLLLVFRLFMKKKLKKGLERSMNNLQQFLQQHESSACRC